MNKNIQGDFPICISVPLMSFSCFSFLDDLLRLYFLLDVSIFTTIDDEKQVKINSSSVLKDFKVEDKVLEIH